ncbi:unnamed protein product [Symbiodinium sp. CCMP2456]|nr:unnamed protein product [Symbiodinium sp. CCMP2456]
MRQARQSGRTPPPPIGKRRPLSKGVDTPPVPKLLTPRPPRISSESEQDNFALEPQSSSTNTKRVAEAVHDFWKTLRPGSTHQMSTEPRWRFSPLARDLEAKQKSKLNRPQSSEKHPVLSSPREPKRSSGEPQLSPEQRTPRQAVEAASPRQDRRAGGGSDVRQVLSSTVRRSATPPTVALMAGLPCHYGEAGKVRDSIANETESLSDSDYCRGDVGRTAVDSDKQIESETSRPQLCDPSSQTPRVPDELAVSQASGGMQGSDSKQACTEDAETQVVRTENEQLSVKVEEAQDQSCNGEEFSNAARAADAQGTRAEPLDFLQLSKTQLSQSGGGQATASLSRDHFESDDPLVTQLWVDCKSLRQEMTELLEIVQRTCKRCRVAPANLTDLTPRSRGMSHKSELRKLVEALCQAHEAAVAGAEITDSQIQRASSPECSKRRQSSAPARSGRSGQRRPAETVGELTREVEYLRDKLQAAEAREAALSERCTAHEGFLEVPRSEGAPERAPEPELTKATDSVLQASGDEGQVKPMKQALDKASRASSWASLDSGAQLLQMARDKKAEVAQLEVLSENTPPGSEEWIQAATQLAAAREELRLLGHWASPRFNLRLRNAATVPAS